MAQAARRDRGVRSGALPENAAALEEHLPYLYRYALAQTRDADTAQEVVQDTLVAALKGLGGFQGRAELRSWLTSILKHKIIDMQRARLREIPTEDLDLADDDEEAFGADGARLRPVADWGDPDQALENSEFWRVVQLCVDDLPQRSARIFMMREVMGESLEEVCKVFGITPTNCAVTLHRARAKMRKCLEAKWFA